MPLIHSSRQRECTCWTWEWQGSLILERSANFRRLFEFQSSWVLFAISSRWDSWESRPRTPRRLWVGWEAQPSCGQTPLFRRVSRYLVAQRKLWATGRPPRLGCRRRRRRLPTRATAAPPPAPREQSERFTDKTRSARRLRATEWKPSGVRCDWWTDEVTYSSVGWLIDWWTYCLMDQLTAWSVDRFFGWLIDCWHHYFIDQLTDCSIDR